MYRSTCDLGPHRASAAPDPEVEEGDSSKENSVIDDNTNHSLPSTALSSKLGEVSEAPGGSPWGRTLTPKSGLTQAVSLDAKSNRTMMASSPNLSVSPSKPNVPWNDLSFAAEVLSPGFSGRVVRAAHASSPRIVREGRRQYPTAQERYVRAGVMPNVRLGGRTKAILTPRRTPSSPLIPLSRSPSAFSSSLSSDFLSSATPRMPDIRSVASVLEPVSTSSECVRDPTSVQAVVAALQQAQAGKGVKRGSCYMEAEDLSKRQRCSTPGASSSALSANVPVNYSREFLEDSHGGSSGVNNGGEKRALDLSPTQGSPQQISPENKRRCVLDPMHASLSSSKYLDLNRLQVSGRDSPFSMYDSRHDTDSESNRSVDSAQSKASEQSLHQQTSEATGGESCVISPGPSERDLSDRSGSHTPQSTRGESWNSLVGGNGGTTNTSRTSTPRNSTPPHHNHVITLEAYKADKTKSQQRLKKMLGMLFHVNESEETVSSKSGSSTPVPSAPLAKNTTEVVPVSSSAPSSTQEKDSSVTVTSSSSSVSLKVPEVSASAPSSSGTVSFSGTEGSESEVTTTYTFSLKPPASSSTEKTTVESEENEKEPEKETNEVSVKAVIKLPPSDASSESSVAQQSSSKDSDPPSDAAPPAVADTPTSSTEEAKTSLSLVDFLKTSVAPPKASPGVSDTVAANPLLQSRLSMPSQILVTPATPVSEGAPLFNIPSAQPTANKPSEGGGGASSGGFTASKPSEGGGASSGSFTPIKSSSAPTSSAPSSGFTFSSQINAKQAPSPFTFGASSSSVSTPASESTGSSTTGLLPKPSSSPFVFGSGSADTANAALPASTTATTTSESGNDPKATAALTGTFTFGSATSAPSTASGFNALATSSSIGSTASSFSLPTSTAPQSGIFTFGAAKTSEAPPSANPPPSYSAAMSTTAAAASNPTPGMMFSFGSKTQENAAISAPSILPTPATTHTSAVTTAATSGFSFGTLPTPSTLGAPSQGNVPTSSSTASTPQPSAFTFGQTASSQAPATTSSSLGFSFSATTQPAGGASVFQFGTTTTATTTSSSQDIKAPASQLFPPSTGSAQSGTAPSSSPFAFGSSAMGTAPTSTTASSPFVFGTPKNDTPAQVPTFGSSTDASTKPASQSGFTFGSAPAPTTNAFSSITPASTANAFSTTTSTASTGTAGFNFGATASSGFSFGASSKAPTTTASSSSPFTFGSSTPKTASFGAPATSTASSPFSFGSSAAAATPSFGSNPAPAFVAQSTSAPTFGTATPTFGSSSSTATSPFASSTGFGATSPTPTFGSGTFGTSAGGGQSGNTPNPFSGQSGSLTFGTSGSSTPGFGGSSTSSNPAAPAPAFGSLTSSNPAAPAFGTPSATPAAAPPPAFGTPSSAVASPPAFGSSSAAPASGGFGATSTPTFGSSTFGATSTSTNNGATSPFQFGQGASNPSPTFGMGGATTPGGAVFQFGSAAGVASPFSAGVLNFGVSPLQGEQQNVFNVGNPGAGPRRPRNRPTRRHR